jgi:hypothetical protein
MPPGRLLLHSFSIPHRRRLGVRQLAAAFMLHVLEIKWINRVFKEGASKLPHSKDFASGKNYSALGVIAAYPGEQISLDTCPCL